jgi:DNA-binding CsgD family transcriptional regulator/PAS domain-containing protein
VNRNADKDRKAILQVIEEETAAYFRKDYEAWARCWIQAPYGRRWMWFGQGGVSVREGWEDHGPPMKAAMERHPEPNGSVREIRRENLSLRVGGEMAWVTFDQYAPDTDDRAFDVPGLQKEMRILEKHEGRWKIACCCVIQRSLDHVRFPLLRVDENAAVIWMNPAGAGLLDDSEVLAVSGGRLHACHREADRRLKAAIRWAASLAEDPSALVLAGKSGSLPVVLGSGRGEPGDICWVIAENGMILVSIRTHEMIELALSSAVAAFGLTPAQRRVAGLVIEGHDMTGAAARLGISVNTARTHLRRLFEKTGVRSQPALVRALLSVAAPLG